MLKARLLLPAAAAAVLLTTSACASGNYQRYPRPGGVYRVDDRAYRNGYEEGRIQGQNDAQRGRSFDYGRHSEYRNAQIGYGGYGNRNEYRDVFRQGFQEGYNEGYRRYARTGSRESGYPSRAPVYRGNPGTIYNGTAVPRSVAGQIGFQDGLEQGQNDARNRKAFNPTGAKRYRSGDHEYNNRYGSRDAYRREYRAAFQQGYEQGYRRY